MPAFLHKIYYFSLCSLFVAGGILLNPLSLQGASADLSINVDNPECGDTVDNDLDTFIDMADPDCTDPSDNTEATISYQCNDAIDNDSDGFIDYPSDPDCDSATDNDETHHGGGGGGDVERPIVVSFTPLQNSTGVSSTTLISATFNEPVLLQTGQIVIRNASDDSIFDTISVNSARVSVSAERIVSIQPYTNFQEGGSYYIELPVGMVNDNSGNSFFGISGRNGWRFTIRDNTPPLVMNATVTLGTNTVTLSWNTNEPAVSVYFWGTTTDYTAGSGVDPSYSTTHISIIGSLIPDTTYLYKINSKDASDNIGSFTGTFKTPPEEEIILPVNPSNFKATTDINFITLTWENPSDPKFDRVRVKRGENSYPINPADGALVYEGSGETVNDLYLSVGKKYYYTIFSKNTDGYYSSGAVTSAIIPVVEIPPPPKVTPEITPVTGPGTPTTTVPLLEILPEEPDGGTGEVVPTFPLYFGDFKFVEVGEGGRETPHKGNVVSLDSNKDVQVFVSSQKLPYGTASVVFTIKKFIEGKYDSAFLLSKKEGSTRHEATLALNNVSGRYNVVIDILDKDARLLARVSGVLDLRMVEEPLLPIFTPALAAEITDITESVAPVALPLGIAVGVSQAVILAGNISSFSDLYLLLLKFFGIIAGLFRRRKSKPWGVVYDSVTKQPIDPAYVVVEDTRGEKKKKTAITDLDGRYGFLVEPGTYSLIANKTHYKFPSEKLVGKSHDEMYENLYFGSLFDVKEDRVLRYNIPLDPIEFDWNEFAKNKDHIFNMYSRREKARALFFNAIYFIGFGISILGTFVSPTRINLIILSFYVLVTTFKEVWKYKHHVTRVLYNDGKPVSFAIVSAEIPDISIPVSKKVTTDLFGRFYLLTPPGVYNIKVQEKQPDETYREIYSKRSAILKRGVLTKDIIVERW